MRFFTFSLFFSLALPAAGQDFTLNGDAVQTGPDCYRLTPASLWNSGSMWSSTEIDLNAPFSLNFTASFDSNPNGADGIVFAFQSAGANALGPDGGSLGYEGIAPSFATEFDIFRNADLGDSNFDHIAVFRNGNVSHQSADNLYGPLQAGPGASIKTGQSYQIKIDWQPDQNRFFVYFDCEQKVFMTIDLINEIFNGNPLVRWGFTAATGGASSELSVCIVNLNTELPAAEETACPGEPVTLTSGQPSTFSHIWSPAGPLDNPELPSPTATVDETTVFTAEISDDCGNTFTKEVVVTVNDQLDIDLGGDRTVCEGDSVLFDLPEGYTYLWSDGSTGHQVSASEAGLWYVEAAWYGCTGSDTALLELSPGISALLTVTEDASCQSEDGSIEILDAEGATPPLSIAVNGIPADDMLIGALGAGDYIVTVSDINGCALTDTVTVGMLSDAEAGFALNPSTGTAPFDAAIDDFSVNATEGYYTWEGHFFPAGSTVLTFDEPGIFEVMQVVWAGDPACADTASVAVVVRAETELIVPNIVTPNNDGRNDILTVSTKGITSLYIEVYNRWGNLLSRFESSSLTDGTTAVWDPAEAADGVYMYALRYTDVNGAVRTEEGNITVARASQRPRF